MMGNRRIITRSIIIINILMFAINILAGGGSAWGLFLSGGGYLKEYDEVSFGSLFVQGQWWRLLTCGYLHMGVLHLSCNMYALWIVGNKVEEIFGAVKTGVLYNLGIVMTAFLWCLIFRSGSMVGASLGIFTLMGVLFIFGRLRRKKGTRLLSRGEAIYLVCYIVVGCFLGIGTIVVHAIGFGVGVLLGWLVGKMEKKCFG